MITPCHPFIRPISDDRVLGTCHGVGWIRIYVSITTFFMFSFSPIILYLTLLPTLTYEMSCSFFAWFYLFIDWFAYLFIFDSVELGIIRGMYVIPGLTSKEKQTSKQTIHQKPELIWSRNKTHHLALLHFQIWRYPMCRERREICETL